MVAEINHNCRVFEWRKWLKVSSVWYVS